MRRKRGSQASPSESGCGLSESAPVPPSEAASFGSAGLAELAAAEEDGVEGLDAEGLDAEGLDAEVLGADVLDAEGLGAGVLERSLAGCSAEPSVERVCGIAPGGSAVAS